MHGSTEIANYFVKQSIHEGKPITPMKLVKLCYISHGWYLGLNDCELLGEFVQAWQYGPVIESVYHDFKRYGKANIMAPVPTLLDGSELSSDGTDAFLKAIWDLFKHYSAIELSAMTHQPGTPWWTAWYDLGGKNHHHAIIPNEIIKDFYKEKIKASNGIIPAGALN
jgi:uncharacterized phage-associated protein